MICATGLVFGDGIAVGPWWWFAALPTGGDDGLIASRQRRAPPGPDRVGEAAKRRPCLPSRAATRR